MNKAVKNTAIVLSLLILTGLGLSIIFSMKKQISEYQRRLEMQEKELMASSETLEILKENTQQMRQYMNLPPMEFDFDSQEDERPQGGNFELAAYDAAALLQEHNSEQTLLKEYSDFINSIAFKKLLQESNLHIQSSRNMSASLHKGDKPYFQMEYISRDKQFLFASSLGDEELQGSLDSPELVQFLENETARMDVLYKRIPELNNQLFSLYYDRELKALLKLDELYFTKESDGLTGRLSIHRIDDSVLLDLHSDLEDSCFKIQNEAYNTVIELKTALKVILEKIDKRTDAKVQDDLVEAELITLLNDPAYRQRLKDLGFTPKLEPREDNDYIYYDLLSETGEVQGSLALQKDFAELYLMDGDDIPVSSLKTFTENHILTYNFQIQEDTDLQSEAFVPAEGSQTFLLIGSHEHNADTMILLHCDSDDSEMRMLSIPRDLYYEGSKINSIYRQYGPQRLVSVLSSITGIPITKYVAIDMYAFIDVVNLLGGIDVELDEALVDPTYKVRENGRWSTLYYPAGTHHLDGIAALRIARSRHTSSDFERSVRQQKVIAGLRDKAGDMNLKDINKIYDLIQMMGKYVQTNLSTTEMVRSFLTYKDYEITGQSVMNTDNILYWSYTNLYRLSKEDQKKALEDPNYYKGGWIVLPKENDWGIIKTFVRSVLTSS